jgi:membrane protease YdiL (CAAX protease family)
MLVVRVVESIGLGLLVLVLVGIVVGAVTHGGEARIDQTWLLPLTNHGPMLLFSLVLILVLGRGDLRTYGLRAPRGRWAAGVLLSAAASALAWFGGKILHTGDLPFLAGASVAKTIALVWVLASTAEEFLTRGLMQGFLTPLAGCRLRLGRARVSVPVLTAALFFGAMHLMLFSMGVDGRTVGLIVAFAFAVGLIAGIFRERTGSLVPPIVIHAAANAVGTLLGLTLPG